MYQLKECAELKFCQTSSTDCSLISASFIPGYNESQSQTLITSLLSTYYGNKMLVVAMPQYLQSHSILSAIELHRFEQLKQLQSK
jgi:hypothetical protein